MSEQEKTALDVRLEQDRDAEDAGLDEPVGARHRSSRLPIILSLLTLSILVGSLFLGYQYWRGMQQSLLQLNSSLSEASRDQSAMRQRLAETHQALQQQQQQIVLQEQALTEQRQLLEQERDSMRQQGVQLNRSLASMQNRLGGNTQQWQVAEAEYLMRVANHRLTLMYDPVTALGALAAADERLRDTGDPVWSDVRQSLAQEMAALKALPQVDKAGLTASLSALAERVERLPLREEGVAVNSIDTPAAAENPQGGGDNGLDLQRIWQDLWQGFKSMMVIRHHQKPIAAMLSPEQGYFLRQNLRLKLEGASIALLGRNPAFYRESLQSSAAWVDRYFVSDTPQVQAFHQQLIDLAKQEIAPELPDISASLRALQAQREAINQGESE